MFNSLVPAGSMIGAGMSGTTAAVSAAIAYAKGLEACRITVIHEGGNLVLEGVAVDRQAIEEAIHLANHISGCPVLSRIKPAL